MAMIITGDCRHEMGDLSPYDMIIADPPYGETKLRWDRRAEGWERTAYGCLRPNGSMWVFGSWRFHMLMWPKFEAAGWQYMQEIVWEKHNGSGASRDRFRRVHEFAVQFIREEDRWEDVYHETPLDRGAAPKRNVPRRGQPAHLGEMGSVPYRTEAGGDLIKRSVIYERSCHGRALHKTQKPIGILTTLIESSCRPGGIVGDFFAGSGSAGEAAHNLGRRYVGCEIDKAMAEIARGRLAQLLPLA